MPKIKVDKSFDHCVGADIYPTRFEKGDEPTVDDRTYQVAVENDWVKAPARTKGKASVNRVGG